MLSVLMRSDLLGVYLITNETDPWATAEQMSRGHLFEVKVIAMVHADLDKIVSALHDCHISDNWFQCSLQHIMGVWAMLSEPDAEAAGSVKSEASELLQSSEVLPTCLTHCTAAEAPLATHLREDVIELLGKLEGKTVLQKLKANTARIKGKPVRMFFFQDTPVTLKG